MTYKKKVGSNSRKSHKGKWITFSTIVITAIITWIITKPLDYIVDAIPEIRKKISALFASQPNIHIKRSTFNNMFTLTKSSDQKDSIIVQGVNTTHRLVVKVTNISNEDLRIKSFEVYDQNKDKLLYNRGFKGDGELVPASEPKDFVVESPSLFGRDDIVRIIETGKLVLVMKTNFGSSTFPIDCICFYNGQIFPNGKHLYSIGKDSSCIKFEYNDPEGAKAGGLVPVDEFLN